jgi:hypothetical protein
MLPPMVRLARVPRRPPWPLWAVAIVAGWLGMIGGIELLTRHYDVRLDLCMVKRFTHLPCPTCGTTRGTLSILQGHPLRAWAFNPLMFTVLAVWGSSLLARLAFARAVRITWTRRGRLIAWAVAVVLILANWAYVIWVGDKLGVG